MFVATKKGGEELTALKKGQKLTDNPKDYMLRVRLDKDTLEKLDECCAIDQTTRSDIVRKGIEIQYAEKKK